ncbi:MAG: starch-binding protein [Paludibacteraceae bacterium]|nr:starch-binding protein [Paludibacteraceae bacterium]
MKRNLIIISILSVAAISIAVASKVWIYQNDNTRLGFDYDKLDSITYVTPGTIALSVSEKNVPFEGGTFDLDVVASQPWTVSISDPNSVKVSQFAGAGNTTLKVIVAQNTSLSARTTTIKFILQDGTPNKLNVITAPWQDKIELSVTKKNIGFEGGSFTIDVKSNISWSVSTNKTWVTLSKTKGEGNEQVKFSIKSTDLMQADTATVAFKTTNGAKKTVQICRAGYPMNIGVLCSKPKNITVSLNSNGYWSNVYLYAWDNQGQELLGKFPGIILTKIDNLYSCTFRTNSPINIIWSNGVSKYDGGYQTKDIVNIELPTYYELRSRTGSYETTKYKYCTDKFTISDDGDTIIMSADGGAISFYIVSEGEWTISSNKKWAEPSQSSGKDSASSIDVMITENTFAEQDTALLSFNSQDGATKKYTIVRASANTILKLDKNNINIGCKGGQDVLKITSNASWTVSSNKSWVTFDKTKGTLNDNINVIVAKNDRVESTNATITITTSNGTTAHCGVTREGDKVSVNPATITLPPAGGTYKIGVTSNTDWTLSASEPWITFDKTKGTLNDSIKVIVAKSDTVISTKAIITVTTSYGKTTYCGVVREGDKVSVSPASKKLLPAGGTYKIGVTSNTDWTISADKPWVSLDKTQGTLNDSVEVIVAKSDKVESTSATITITTSKGETTQCSVIRAGDEVYVRPYSKTLAPIGGTYKIGVTSNTDWTVSASESWVTFDKTKGTLNDSIKVNIAKSDKVKSTEATINIITSNGKTAECIVTRESDKISVSPIIKEFMFDGGTVVISVTSNTEWTASSNKSWVTLSASYGCGNGIVTATISKNTSLKVDTAIVTLTSALGETASTSIIILGMEKCKASDYPQITIGTQVWMAENYRCSKYDTKSEAYKASWLEKNTIPTPNNLTYATPYYIDASYKTKWDYIIKYEKGVNLNEEQVTKLGYLYNWAAAVGVADGEKLTSYFSGKRQGICPNGWHVPSRAEWQTLYDYIYKDKSLSSNQVGKYLKTASGWYNNGNGTDTYGFAALPAGTAYGSKVQNIGTITEFQTTTPYADMDDRYYAYICGLGYNSGYLGYYDSYDSKSYALSVRCLKD